MKTMIDYIREYGNDTFEKRPLCEIDSLILSQFSYLKFDRLVPGFGDPSNVIDIQTLWHDKDYESLYADERFRGENTELFLTMVQSTRFGSLKMKNYVNHIDREQETQFSAITFLLGDGTFYVAYRGTDENLVGWKEDLDLAFSEPVPGQVMSVDYLNRTSEQIETPFYVGGHSKGGNLAVYAAMNCERAVQDKILLIYDHDGPGFRPEVKESCGYERIGSRVRKTVPHSSLVGMILYDEEDYKVVASKNLGITQHDPYSWLVDRYAFKTARQIHSGRMLFDKSLNEWILSLSQEEMHVFVDTLYAVIMASEADNLIDFSANWQRSIQKITDAAKNVDARTIKIMSDMLRALFDKLSQNAKEELLKK